MVIKVSIIMLCYFCVSMLLNISLNVIIWSFYFLAFLSIVSAVGDIKTRRKVFVFFTCIFILVLTFSHFLHQFDYLTVSIILLGSYLAFWVRRFGPVFRIFPGYLIIVLAISSIQLPISNSHLLQLYVSIFFESIAFFILILVWTPWDTPKQLKRIIFSHSWLIIKESKKWLNMHSQSSSKVTFKGLDQSIKKNFFIIETKGNSWIITSERKDLWHTICFEYKLLINNIYRMVFFYETLIDKQKNKKTLIFQKSNINTMIKLTINLFTNLFTTKSTQYFLKSCEKYSKAKHDFQIFIFDNKLETLGYHTLLYEMIFIFDSVEFFSKQMRKNLDDLV